MASSIVLAYVVGRHLGFKAQNTSYESYEAKRLQTINSIAFLSCPNLPIPVEQMCLCAYAGDAKENSFAP